MTLGASPSLIRSSVAAVRSRHTDIGFAPPPEREARVQAYNEGCRVASGDSQESNHPTLAAYAMAFDAAQATYFRAESECVGDCAGYTAVLSGKEAEAPKNLQFSPWFQRNFSPNVPLLGGF